MSLPSGGTSKACCGPGSGIGLSLTIARSFCHLVAIEGIAMTGRRAKQTGGFHRKKGYLPNEFPPNGWFHLAAQVFSKPLIVTTDVVKDFKRKKIGRCPVSLSLLAYFHLSLSLSYLMTVSSAELIKTHVIPYPSIEMGMNWIRQDAIIALVARSLLYRCVNSLQCFLLPISV